MSFESLRKPPKTAIHLWEFLLNLLLDEKCNHMICWTNREAGEFKLKNQEEVARRWGNLKHRPGMNYDKLSRALRYYYQKGIIKKVNGQRLVYKFVKPPLAKESPSLQDASPKAQTPPLAATNTNEESGKEKQDFPTIPCVRTNSLTLPQTTMTSSPMGFRIIQAPLVSPSHMTYPVSIYPYIVPCVIPACRQVGIIKS